MALPAIADDLDAIPEAFRSEYEERDGRFVLAVDGLDAHPGAAALANALKRVRDEKKTLADRLKAAEERTRGLPDDFSPETYTELAERAAGSDPAKVDERLKRQREADEARLTREVEAREKRIAKMGGALQRTLIDDGLRKELVEGGTDRAYLPAALALLKQSGAIKLHEDDDGFHVFADNGIDERTPLPVYVRGFLASDEGKVFVAKPTGGDAKGGTGQRLTDNPFAKDNFNKTRQAELIDANPVKARQLAEVAGVKPYW